MKSAKRASVIFLFSTCRLPSWPGLIVESPAGPVEIAAPPAPTVVPPSGDRSPARAHGRSALDGAFRRLRNNVLRGGWFEMGAAVGHYQCVYAEFPVLAVKAHAEIG